MPQDNFEDILRKKLTDHELKAPDGLWEDIEAAMQAGQRRRHIRILRLATIGIAAAARNTEIGQSFIGEGIPTLATIDNNLHNRSSVRP